MVYPFIYGVILQIPKGNYKNEGLGIDFVDSLLVEVFSCILMDSPQYLPYVFSVIIIQTQPQRVLEYYEFSIFTVS